MAVGVVELARFLTVFRRSVHFDLSSHRLRHRIISNLAKLVFVSGVEVGAHLAMTAASVIAASDHLALHGLLVHLVYGL